jgi:hypothetical protein
VQRVIYYLRTPAESTATGKELIRGVTRNLLATLTVTPDEEMLLSNVKNLEIECYDGSQWRNTWDTTESDTNLPVAVRFRIEQASHIPNLEPLELLVPISVQITTNEAAVSETETETASPSGMETVTGGNPEPE